MTTVVFAGPSLGRVAAPGIELRAPARCGDIARAAAAGAARIGLIDGAFEETASVWPKEILWALSRGVAVCGAASMGALRAVELAPFGMVGVGRVFRAYARGTIRDDDEVAVLHGPAEAGWPVLSEAMVNIRATLARAQRLGVVDRATAGAVVAAAKALHYKERSYEAAFEAAGAAGAARAAIAPLARWVAGNRADVKREDARQLLRAVAAARPPARRPAFVATTFWHELELRCAIDRAAQRPAR